MTLKDISVKEARKKVFDIHTEYTLFDTLISTLYLSMSSTQQLIVIADAAIFIELIQLLVSIFFYVV